MGYTWASTSFFLFLCMFETGSKIKSEKKTTAQTASRVSSRYSQNETLTHVRPAHLSPQPEASPTYLLTVLALWSSYWSPITELLPLPGKLSLKCLSPLDIQSQLKHPLFKGCSCSPVQRGPGLPLSTLSTPGHTTTFSSFSHSLKSLFLKNLLLCLLCYNVKWR